MYKLWIVVASLWYVNYVIHIIYLLNSFYKYSLDICNYQSDIVIKKCVMIENSIPTRLTC